LPALLLDLDGTLIDSRPGITACLFSALRTLGHDLDPATDLTFAIGPPMQDAMARLLAPYGDTRVEAAVAAYRAAYAGGGIFEATVYPGIPALLETLAGRYRLYLATSKRTIFARSVLDHFRLSSAFAGIHGAEPNGLVDHKPELIAAILTWHGLAPAQATMIGDRSYDISGAHANGLRAIGVLWGYGTRAELEQAGADRLAATPAALAGLLRSKESKSVV
jgi:phosphoglycolate phosphatase